MIFSEIAVSFTFKINLSAWAINSSGLSWNCWKTELSTLLNISITVFLFSPVISASFPARSYFTTLFAASFLPLNRISCICSSLFNIFTASSTNFSVSKFTVYVDFRQIFDHNALNSSPFSFSWSTFSSTRRLLAFSGMITSISRQTSAFRLCLPKTSSAISLCRPFTKLS